MTRGEIVSRYRYAKDKGTQILILADLNACRPIDIARMLGRPDMESQERHSVLRILLLYDQGLTDSEIAKKLNMTRNNVAAHRLKCGLQPNKKEETT